MVPPSPVRLPPQGILGPKLVRLPHHNAYDTRPKQLGITSVLKTCVLLVFFFLGGGGGGGGHHIKMYMWVSFPSEANAVQHHPLPQPAKPVLAQPGSSRKPSLSARESGNCISSIQAQLCFGREAFQTRRRRYAAAGCREQFVRRGTSSRWGTGVVRRILQRLAITWNLPSGHRDGRARSDRGCLATTGSRIGSSAPHGRAAHISTDSPCLDVCLACWKMLGAPVRGL